MEKHIPSFRDDDFFTSTAFENKTILQYTIDVMKEMATKDSNQLFDYDGHQIYQFSTDDWHVLFYQHDNIGSVYFEKQEDYKTRAFKYPMDQLIDAQKNNTKIEDLHFSCDFSFGAVSYDLDKLYKSQRQLEMELFSAVHVNKDKAAAKAIEKQIDDVDSNHYHLVGSADLITCIKIFNQLGIEVRPPSIQDIHNFSTQYAVHFEPDYQKTILKGLEATKKLCLEHDNTQLTDRFYYNDSDNTVYYHTEKKALVFTDSNMGFVAFEKGNKSWDVAPFSYMYSSIESEGYYFENPPKLENLTLQIKEGKFTHAGSNMYSFHFNALYAPNAIHEAHKPSTSKKKKM